MGIDEFGDSSIVDKKTTETRIVYGPTMGVILQFLSHVSFAGEFALGLSDIKSWNSETVLKDEPEALNAEIRLVLGVNF
jgi:hypothetical protein